MSTMKCWWTAYWHFGRKFILSLSQLVRWTTFRKLGKWHVLTHIETWKNNKAISFYHPIAFISYLEKLLQHVTNNRLLWRLETNSHLNNFYYGFRNQRRTNDAMFYLTNKICECFQKQKSTMAVDRSAHITILLQLIKLGIGAKRFYISQTSSKIVSLERWSMELYCLAQK